MRAGLFTSLLVRVGARRENGLMGEVCVHPQHMASLCGSTSAVSCLSACSQPHRDGALPHPSDTF